VEYCPALDERKYRESGNKFIPHDIMFETKENETKAPKHLTESELLGLMDKHAIGTDASMATHIQTIIDRHYVEVKEGRRLVPTKLGCSMVHGYQLVDYELVLPKIRADMEACCTAIAKGEAKRGAVVRHSLDIFKEKFDFFKNNIEYMETLWNDEFQVKKPEGEEGEEDEEGAANLIDGKGADEAGEKGEDWYGDRDAKKGKGKGKKGDRDGKKGKGKKGDRDREWKDDGWKDDGWKEKKWEDRPPREDKGKGKGGKEGGKRLPKQRHELEDSDLTQEDKQLMMEFYPSSKSAGAITVVKNPAKEKELMKIKKKLRDIENLEKKADEGKKLDGLQKKKMQEKDELMEQMEQLEAKLAVEN